MSPGRTGLAPTLATEKDGEALIRDEQGGLAKEESATLIAETPEVAAKGRATADLNEAAQLLDSGAQSVVALNSFGL